MSEYEMPEIPRARETYERIVIVGEAPRIFIDLIHELPIVPRASKNTFRSTKDIGSTSLNTTSPHEFQNFRARRLRQIARDNYALDAGKLEFEDGISVPPIVYFMQDEGGVIKWEPNGLHEIGGLESIDIANIKNFLYRLKEKPYVKTFEHTYSTRWNDGV
jgi:hypothetical protein